MATGPVLRHITREELIRRKTELTRILTILSLYTRDEVCSELREIGFLLREDTPAPDLHDGY